MIDMKNKAKTAVGSTVDSLVRRPHCKQTMLKKKTCPHCGSHNVIMFTADDDICQKCKRWFLGT